MRLITALDIAKRDRTGSVRAWIRGVSGKMQQSGKLTVMWDGRSVSGEPVQAIVNNGRVLAICDKCRNAEYVDANTPIFYCMACGNDNSASARPVEFPEDWEQVKAALEAREIMAGPGRNEIEKVLRSKPKALAREWRPGVKAEELEVENRKVTIPQKGKVKNE